MRESDADRRRSIEARIEGSYGIRANDDTVARIVDYVDSHGGEEAGEIIGGDP